MLPQFLLFRASAGSGKTFNLAIQYIALLTARGEHEFRHTLAVTFTNKATAEMKDRILEYLHAIWRQAPHGEGPMRKLQKVLSKQYGIRLTDEETRERCHRALKAILHDYSRFYVSTIDAFFQHVLRNMAHELGLTARLQADINTDGMVEMAVENLLENLRQDNRDVLPWLREYIEQRLSDGKPWDVRRELKQMARLLFQENYLKRSLDEGNRPLSIDNIADFRKLLEQERAPLLSPIQQAATAFNDTLDGLGMTYEELFSYGKYVRGYVERLMNGDLSAKFSSTLQGFVDDSTRMLQSKLHRDPSMVAVTQDFSERLGRLHDLHSKATHRLNSIDIILRYLTPMGLLGAIDNEVTRISNEYNRFMLARTPIMLKRMIGGEDAPFVFERIGTQFNNIMIDEFQDTSRLQWENFRVLLLDNLASGGLSMIVGDIKQSIYRFRNGDWTILHELGTHGHNGLRLKEEPLKDNFRSLANIIDFNNRFFPIAARTLDTLSHGEGAPLTELYADVEQGKKRKGDEGYVRIRVCRAKDNKVADDWPNVMFADLCQQVERLHREQAIPYKKMTILVRYSRYIQPIISYFADHMPEVRLVSNEAFKLGASIAVKMLVNAMQVVDDRERDPVALYYLAEHYQRDIMGNPSAIAPAMPEEYLALLPEDFTQHLEELRSLPLYEMCETLYRVLQLDRIAQQDAYMFTFFDELSAYLHENPSDIPTFMDYWQETMAAVNIPNSEIDGIRIYTIHKSKGLAFHTVLMPFAEWAVEDIRYDALYWCTPDEKPFDRMGALPVNLGAKARESVFAKDYLQEHANLRADELNSLYVAFTRAENNLLVWGMSRNAISPDKTSETVADLMNACLPQLEGLTQDEEEGSPFSTYTMGEAPSPAMPERTEETMDVNMFSSRGTVAFQQSARAAAFVRQPDSEEEPDRQTLSYIEKGKLLHYVFSQIETANDVERIATQLAQRGVLKSDKQVRQVCSLASQGLRNERVKEWFSGRYVLFNECNILIPDPAHEGKLLKRRPDRVMMSDERIIIVDFKFGKPKPEYREQVAQYIEILKSMYPDKEVEGWLWYVYTNRVEAVKGE